jgi:hypothetical protein
MCSHCLFPVVDKSGTSCYHLVTRLSRLTDSRQVVPTSLISSARNKLSTSWCQQADIGLPTTLLQLVCRSVAPCTFLRVLLARYSARVKISHPGVYIVQWTLILPPPPYLYYISLKGLYLIVILWHSIFGVLWPMGANGGIDKHRQNENKMKENWRKWNFEGNFKALNFDQNQEKIRKKHFGKWKHWFSQITHGNFSLLFPLPFHFFYSSLIFFPSPKTLWFFSPTPGGGGDYRRIYTPGLFGNSLELQYKLYNSLSM